jgi:Endoplasmic Reticulum Oxidoreductin 1 (ERO1)
LLLAEKAEEDEFDWMHNMELDNSSVYINLIENAEAFTAFNGSHVWKAIYEENCFNYGADATCSE